MVDKKYFPVYFKSQMERSESFKNTNDLFDHIRFDHSYPNLNKRWHGTTLKYQIFYSPENIILDSSKKFMSNLVTNGKNSLFLKIPGLLNFYFFDLDYKPFQPSLENFISYKKNVSDEFMQDSLGHFSFLKEFLDILVSNRNVPDALVEISEQFGIPDDSIWFFVNFICSIFPGFVEKNLN